MAEVEKPSDVTTRAGQPLVPVPRRRGRPPRVAAEPSTDAPDLSLDERYHLPTDDVPPEVTDPSARSKPTIGVIELTDDAREPPAQVREVELAPDLSDAVPRTLEDLMGMFPIGNGQYYIYVERKQPTAYNGVATKGVLKKIKEPLTLEQFIDGYGGGMYDLIAYGPPRRGGTIDPATGLVRPKALTKPVRFTIPYHGMGGHPPNPDAMFEESDEDEMNDTRERDGEGLPRVLFSRGATPATARMFETHLTHEDRREQRQREDKQRREQRELGQTSETIRLLEEHARQRESYLENQIKELKDELRRDGQKKPSELEGVAKVLSSVLPRGAAGDTDSLRAEHQRELDRIHRAHDTELENLRRTHNEERERRENQARLDKDRGDERVKLIETNAAERIRDVEQRLDRERNERIAATNQLRTELRAEHERELASLKNEHERELRSQKDHYEVRLADERRQAERDEKLRKETFELQLQSQKTPLDAEVKRLEAELRRAQADVERFKHEAEKGKDLGKQIEQATRQAELLGFVKKDDIETDEAAEPKDWKSIFATVGIDVAKRIPEILESAARAAAAVRGGGAPAAAQGMGPAPEQRFGQRQVQVTQPPPIRQGFLTEDSGISPPPLVADYQPQSMVPVVTTPTLPEVQAPPVPVASQPASPPVAAAAPVPVPVPVPVPATRQAQAAPPAQAAEPLSADAEKVILDARPDMEQWTEHQAPPEQIAAALMARFGVDMVRGYATLLTPEQVSAVLTKHGLSASPLVKRKGQRYLRALQEAIQKELAEKGAVG